MEQLLRCILRVEEIELSRSAHNNGESRWRKNVLDFASRAILTESGPKINLIIMSM